MFLGTFPSIVKKDNRVSVPPKFSKELGGEGAKIVIAESHGNCLCLIPSGNLEDMERYIAEASHFHIAEIKSKNRIPISNGFREYAGMKTAGLDSDIIFAGCGGYVEIWSKERWNNQK